MLQFCKENVGDVEVFKELYCSVKCINHLPVNYFRSYSRNILSGIYTKKISCYFIDILCGSIILAGAHQLVYHRF